MCPVGDTFSVDLLHDRHDAENERYTDKAGKERMGEKWSVRCDKTYPKPICPTCFSNRNQSVYKLLFSVTHYKIILTK